jgi:hypothetical protein
MKSEGILGHFLPLGIAVIAIVVIATVLIGLSRKR